MEILPPTDERYSYCPHVMKGRVWNRFSFFLTCLLWRKIRNSVLDTLRSLLEMVVEDFPGGTVVKNPPANAGDTGSSPGPGRCHMPRSN